MRRVLAIITALAITLAGMTTVFAADVDLKSTDTAVLTDTLTSMSDTEKTEFVNENLDVKMQHLSTLATLSANRAYDAVADEVKAALDDGLTAVEIKEAIYHSAAYCGYTRAAGALDAADEALKSLGKDIPYSSRITSTEENRYNDGLNVQRELFGPQIGTITDDMSEAMKLQTLYLSGICFGDFYNRTGLSLYTREFLTFCTIVANGNCGGQLMGHANGNLNVGHSADMLRAAVLLNEKYNGAEKTALALSVINTVDSGESKTAPTEPTGTTETITTSYKSDSEELLGIIAHYDADDKDGFIDKNLDAKTQEVILNTVNAVIEGTAVPTSDDAKAKALIDLTVIAAQGGREDEVPANYAANIAAGNTADTMLAAALLCTPYNGFPRTLNIMSAINSAVNAAPAQSDKTTVTMRINDPVMTINGAEKNIDENGTVPVIIDDRTLLPVRAFVEGIGGTVEWDESAKTATLAYNGNVIKLTIDSTTAYLNDEAQTLDVTPVIINDRTMLPIRFIAESFGYTVMWNSDTQTVTIMNADKINYVFPRGSENPVPNFTGTSYLNFLTGYDETMKIPSMGLVTFEPCTRTDWHSHDGEQILLVTEGKGIFKMEGEDARYMMPGDVILIPPGKKHVHAAADDSWFAHIALSTNPNAGTTNWFEKVSDEEYAQFVAEAKAQPARTVDNTTMFPIGNSFSGEGYTGTIHKNTLVEYESVWNCPEVNNYTFEAGARTAWHSHEGGQIIAVTNGTGVYQEEGGEPRIIKAGDVITAAPGVKHWHGAADGNFAYIAVNGDPGNDKITWDKAVTEEEYTSARGTSDSSAIAQTTAGQVHGSYTDGVYQYLGVPYAEAKEMFVRADAVTPWDGVRDATQYGNTSPQGAIAGGTNIDSGDGTSNNCQNLNIWTPANDGKKRAVMVWLHGGGFSSGSANEEQFNGANLAKNQDVVVVGVNHRLNVFGHLDLSSYGEKYKYSENIGIWDIIDALTWIKNNIESFGGDSSNVTVFGESGGGAKVLALMTSPYAKGLFGKGIVESGATEGMGVYFAKKEHSEEIGALTLEKLGLTAQTVDEIQNKSNAEIQNASNEAMAEVAEKYKIPVSLGEGYAYEWEPVVDGDFLPTDPVLENGFAEAGKDIPLLIGSNLNEWSMWIPTEAHTDMTDAEKAEYEKAYPNEAPETAVYVDTLIRKPMLKIMSHKADQNGAKVYAYLFTKQIGDMGSYHGAEIPFVFGSADDKLADTMSEAWANFAKTGVPSADGLPEWEAYDRENMAMMILDDESYLAHNHDKTLFEMLEPDYKY